MATQPEPTEVPEINFLTDEEGREIFERLSRKYFGMSAAEFIEAWESGELDDHPDHSRVVHLEMLLPLVDYGRKNSG